MVLLGFTWSTQYWAMLVAWFYSEKPIGTEFTKFAELGQLGTKWCLWVSVKYWNAPTKPPLKLTWQHRLMVNNAWDWRRYITFNFEPLTISLIIYCMKTKNIFDSLPTICAPKMANLCDELDRYLSTDPEHTDDVLMWWAEWRGLYPCLSCMVLDYLLIPGISVYVWCCFFNAYILCSYLCQCWMCVQQRLNFTVTPS